MSNNISYKLSQHFLNESIIKTNYIISDNLYNHLQLYKDNINNINDIMQNILISLNNIPSSDIIINNIEIDNKKLSNELNPDNLLNTLLQNNNIKKTIKKPKSTSTNYGKCDFILTRGKNVGNPCNKTAKYLNSNKQPRCKKHLDSENKQINKDNDIIKLGIKSENYNDYRLSNENSTKIDKIVSDLGLSKDQKNEIIQQCKNEYKESNNLFINKLKNDNLISNNDLLDEFK
jgi:hypothetical protein